MENLKLDDVLLNEYAKLSSFEDKKKFFTDFYNDLECSCYTLEHAIFNDYSLTRLELNELDNILNYDGISLDIAISLFSSNFKEDKNNENAK